MNHYAGLDVSLEETAICVVDSTGQIVKEARAASEPETLIAALREIDLPLECVGLEACSLTAWLHDELHSAGLPAVCIETRHANAAMKTNAKQDRPQRRQGAGPDHAHGLVQAGPRQEPSVPAVALAPGRAPLGPERDALDRERGAGGPAGRRPQVGNPEPSGFRRARARPHGRGCLGEAAR